MKVTLESQHLQKALRRAKGIAKQKGNIVITRYLHLVADKGSRELVITAFDLDVAVVSRFTADVQVAGSLCLPAHQGDFKTEEFIAALDGDVTLEKLKQGYVEVRAGNTVSKLMGAPPEDFPKLPQEEGLVFSPVAGSSLLEMVERISHAMSKDDARPVLCAAYLHRPLAKGPHRMVATDGSRLAALDRVLHPKLALPKHGIIIPDATLKKFKEVLKDDPGEGWELAANERVVVLRKGGLTVQGRLMDGQYPEYARVIPTPEATAFAVIPLVHTREMLARVKVLPEKFVLVSLKDGQMSLRTEHADGTAADSIGVAYNGPPTAAFFDPRYLKDALEQAHGDEVRLYVPNYEGEGQKLAKNENKPLLLREITEDTFVSVVMPRAR